MVFPEGKDGECNMARIDIRQIVRALKHQRRQIDRAINALEAIEEQQPRKAARRVPAKRPRRHTPAQSGNGTRGQLIPFVRRRKLTGT
jgi:hypothetical protein